MRRGTPEHHRPPTHLPRATFPRLHKRMSDCSNNFYNIAGQQEPTEAAGRAMRRSAPGTDPQRTLPEPRSPRQHKLMSVGHSAITLPSKRSLQQHKPMCSMFADVSGVARCQLPLQNILMLARGRGDGGLQQGGGGATACSVACNGNVVRKETPSTNAGTCENCSMLLSASVEKCSMFMFPFRE